MRIRVGTAMRAALVVLAVLLPACGGGQTDDHGQDSHGAAESVPEPVADAAEITVTAVDIDFRPAAIELDAAEPTNVTIVNEGETLHDFTLEEAGVHANVEAGQEITLGLAIDEPGTYQAVCTVPGHEEAGMVVDVTVR